MIGRTGQPETAPAIGSLVKLPPLLDQIIEDVTVGIKATQRPDADQLAGNFAQSIRERFMNTKREFFSGGRYFKVMDSLRGEQYSAQPFESMLSQVTQVAALTDEQQRQLISRRMNRLLSEYYVAGSDPTVSQLAWGRFVRAHQNLSVYDYGREFHGSFPTIWYDATQYLHLPTTIIENYLEGIRPNPDRGTILKEAELKTAEAKAVGILTPQETWLDFIHRDNIRQVDRLRWDRRTPPTPGVIIGEVWEEGSSWRFGGVPIQYNYVPTKYPGILAYVSFLPSIGRPGKFDRKLDDLIQEGGIWPKVALVVSNPALFGFDKPQ